MALRDFIYVFRVAFGIIKLNVEPKPRGINQFGKAKLCFNQAVEPADAITSFQMQSEARTALAAAHLVCGDLPAAQEIAEAARKYP